MGGPDEEWEEYNSSGFIPMILASYRMSAARRTFPGLENLAESVSRDVESEAAEFLAWSKAHQHDEPTDDSGFFIDMAAAEDYAGEMLAAKYELPGLFFGGLIVYLLSTLEATLADCVEEAQIVMQRPVGKRVSNPKLENYIKALEDCGVQVGWDHEIWVGLRAWRKVRNKFVHTLGMLEATASGAQEVFWLVDSALRELDHAMSAVNRSSGAKATEIQQSTEPI